VHALPAGGAAATQDRSSSRVRAPHTIILAGASAVAVATTACSTTARFLRRAWHPLPTPVDVASTTVPSAALLRSHYVIIIVILACEIRL